MTSLWSIEVTMLYKTVAFFTLFLFVKADLNTNGECYVYSYCGTVIVGSRSDGDFKTYNEICGDLEFKTQNKDIWMKLSNVTYKVFASHAVAPDTVSVPIDKKSKYIELPFVYHRYAYPTKKGITLMSDDKSWSRYYKQGIADLFDLDDRVLASSSNAFKSDGFQYEVVMNDNMDYVIRTKTKEYYELDPRKGVNPNNGTKLPMVIKQEYAIDKREKHPIINAIASVSNMEFTPFESRGVNFYLLLNQSVELKYRYNNPIVRPEGESYYENNSFLPMYRKGSGVVDLEELRNFKTDLQDLVSSVKEDLENIYARMEKKSISPEMETVIRSHTAGSIIERLRKLNTKHVKDLYNAIKNSSNKNLEKILLQMIALAGKPSHCEKMLLEMIAEKKISKENTILLLRYMAKSIAGPENMGFIEKLFEIVKNTEIDREIRDAGVLTMSRFVTLIYGVEEKFFEYFMDNVKVNVSDPNYQLYISAIANINSEERKNNALMSIVNNSDMPKDARAYALQLVDNVPEKHNLFFSILLNFYQPFELRATALLKLIDYRYPENFKTISQLQLNEDLNNLFWTKMKGFSTSDIPHFEAAGVAADEILTNIKYLSKNPFLSSSNIFDFMDNENGNSAGFVVTHYGVPEVHKSMTYNVEIWNRKIDSSWNHQLYRVNLKWANETEAVSLLSFNDFFRKSIYGITMSFSSIRNGVVESTSIMTFKQDLEDTFMNWIIDNMQTSHLVDQPTFEQIVISTDMGIPVVFFVENTNLVQREFDRSVKNKALNIEYDYDKYEFMGIQTYSAISNTYHQVKRVNLLNARFSLNAKVANESQLFTKIKFDLPDKPIGFKTIAYDTVDMWDNDGGETIKASCSSCERESVIIDDVDTVTKKMVHWENDGTNSGISCEFSSFNIPGKIADNYKYLLFKRLMDTETMSYGDSLWKRAFLSMYKLYDIFAVPVANMEGAGFMCQKTNKYNVNQIELKIRNYLHDIVENWDMIMIHYNYYVKNDDKVINIMEFNIDSNTTLFNSVTDVRVKTSPDQMYCYKNVKTWQDNFVEVEHNYSQGKGENDECPKVNIMVKGKAELFGNQKKKLGEVFDECQSYVLKSFADCVFDITNYDKIEYDVTFDELPKGVSNLITVFLDNMRSMYADDFIRKFDVDTKMKDQTGKIVMQNSLDFNGLDIEISTNKERYIYKDLSWSELLFPRFQIEYNYLTSLERMYLYHDYCEATTNYVILAEDGPKYSLKYDDQDWAVLSKWCSDDKCDWVIKVKKMSNDSEDLILRVETEDEFAEVTFDSDLKVDLNGKMVPLDSEKFIRGNKIGYMVLKNGDKNRVFVTVNNESIVVYYDRDNVKQLYSSKFHKGNCYAGFYKEIYVVKE